VAKQISKQGWWGGGEAPHLRWPGVTIEIPCEWVAARKRWESSGYYFDERAANFAADFFPTMLEHHIGEFNGLPFELLPYQRHIVRAAFGWKHIGSNLRRFRKLFIAVPKGSGKSPLCSGLGLLLAFFDYEPGSEVFVVANDRKQARIVHDTSKIFVYRSKHLSAICEVFTDSIKLKGSTESLQVLSSDVATAHGYRPHGVIFDEFHGAASRDLFEALYRGMGKKREPMLIMVTTAGNDDESICAEEWQYAENVIKNPSVDETYLPMIFQAKPEDDWTSPALWRRINPGLGITVKEEYFVNECRAAQLEPRKRNSFLQLHLNRWVNQATAWLPVEWIDRCISTLPPDRELADLDVTAGLDMSQKYDLTAFVLCFRRPLPDSGESVVWTAGEDVESKNVPLNYTLILIPHFWIPEDTLREHEKSDGVPYGEWVRRGWVTATAGNVIDYSRVHADILKTAARFRKLKSGQIGFDPAFAGDIAQKLAAAGFTTVEVPQNAQHLSEPSQVFEALVKSGRVIYDGNRCMRWCIENVSVKTDGGGRIRPVKPRQQSRRIDGVVAAVMGLSRLIVARPAERRYQAFVL
jgi:phage terminase large subunit-like protein